jgi:hypothetical protein
MGRLEHIADLSCVTVYSSELYGGGLERIADLSCVMVYSNELYGET